MVVVVPEEASVVDELHAGEGLAHGAAGGLVDAAAIDEDVHGVAAHEAAEERLWVGWGGVQWGGVDRGMNMNIEY